MCRPISLYVAIGANLPSLDGRTALATCLAAAESLRGLPGLRLAGLSPWYETAPIPPGGPPYVNGMAWLAAPGDLDPAWLLARLQAIETRAGRTRSEPNAPRTLDLDIIAIESWSRERPDPVLPHPRAHLRRFVMQPLADLAPDWWHPHLCQTAQAILANLPAQAIRRL